MMSCCASQIACVQFSTSDAPDLIQKAAVSCMDISEATLGDFTQAVAESNELEGLAGSCQTEMRGLGLEDDNDRSLFARSAPRLFQKIRSILEAHKSRDAVEYCRKLQNSTQHIVGKTKDMTEAIREALDSLPEQTRQEYGLVQEEEEVAHGTRALFGGDDDDEAAPLVIRPPDAYDQLEAQELSASLDIDGDVNELEGVCVKTRGGLDLFHASSVGSSVFSLARSKGKRCHVLLDQMKSVCSALSRLSESVLGEASCCVQFKAAWDSIKTLIKCNELVELLQRAARSVLRIINKILDLLTLAWRKIEAFADQFQAAKKIGKFVKNSFAGKLARKGKQGIKKMFD